MSYNPQTDAQIIVSKPHRDLLKKVGVKQGRKMRQQAEFLIAQAAKKEKIS